MKLLCLTRDQGIAHQVREEAASQQWSAAIVENRDEVCRIVRDFDPDMLLVDVESMEDLDWWQAKGHSEHKPVIFINGQLTEDFVVRAFECGADGLVPKPLFSRRFLAARVNAYLRRQGLAGKRQIVRRLNMVLDGQRYRAEVKGTSIPLTLTEYKILRELATDESRVVERQALLNQVFETASGNKRSLDVHVCSLRKKLRPYNLDIASARGVGYRLNPCAS